MRRTYRKPYRLKNKKSVFRNRFFWIGFFISTFIIFSFYFLFIFDLFQIKKITIAGEKTISKEEINSAVEGKLDKKIFFFKTRSIFLINLKEIESVILNEFVKIDMVQTERRFPDALNISLNERKGAAVWCRDEKCFFLDKEGIIFEEAQPKGDLIRIKDEQKLKSFVLGEKIIEKDLLEKILKIKTETSELFAIEDFLFFEDRLNVKTLDGWYVYFDIQKDLDWQIIKLKAVLEEKISPEKRKDLEYIELRFGNFAPYKYKD